jgi:hypothetical protein
MKTAALLVAVVAQTAYAEPQPPLSLNVSGLQGEIGRSWATTTESLRRHLPGYTIETVEGDGIDEHRIKRGRKVLATLYASPDDRHVSSVSLIKITSPDVRTTWNGTDIRVGDRFTVLEKAFGGLYCQGGWLDEYGFALCGAPINDLGGAWVKFRIAFTPASARKWQSEPEIPEREARKAFKTGRIVDIIWNSIDLYDQSNKTYVNPNDVPSATQLPPGLSGKPFVYTPGHWDVDHNWVEGNWEEYKAPMAASSITSDDPIRPAARRRSPTDH